MSEKIRLERKAADDERIRYKVIWAGRENGTLGEFLDDLGRFLANAGDRHGQLQLRRIEHEGEIKGPDGRNGHRYGIKAAATLSYDNGGFIDGLNDLDENLMKMRVASAIATECWDELDFYVTAGEKGGTE